MTRADLLALRQRVIARGGFPKLLAAIELMILHHEPGYEHELHPDVRSYRVACHAAALMREAAHAASADEQVEAERRSELAYDLANRQWRHLERHHPALAAKVTAGPNSYKQMGVTPV